MSSRLNEVDLRTMTVFVFAEDSYPAQDLFTSADIAS